MSKEHTALKQRWSSLTAAQRALLVRRLDGERNNAETTGAARASIRKEPPPLVDVDAEGRQVAVYPASIGQQRLWFLDQLDRTAGAAYHLAAGLQLQGRLDRGALRATLDAIVARHEVLRTSFVLLDEQPVQRIAPAEVGFHLIEHDLSGQSGAAQQQRVNELSGSEATERFDLSTGPLIRGQLLRLGPEEHLLLITQHHIISDGWSIGVLVREVATLYGAFSQGQPNPLPPLGIQYADYAVWQRQWLQAEVLHEQVGFWRAHLAGAPGLLELPNDRPRPAVQSYAGGRVGLTLSGQLTAGLRRLSQRHGVTLFMSLLAGWSALLSRLSGQSDLVIGTPVANRPRSELESLIGFFVNTLALRVRLEDDPSVAELLAQIRASTLEAYAHQDIPFAQVVEALQPARSLSYNPIFQVMLAFDNAPGERALSLPGLKVSEFKPPRSSAKFDLTLGLRDVGERIEGVLEYATDLFERARIERMASHLLTLLEAMVADDQQRISALKLLSQAERDQLQIVQIQPLGRKTPIIAINNTMMYYGLAQRIGTDRRFLSVQLFDPSDPKPLPSRSLEQITADYVHLIRAAQPHGPYILMGLCVAGLIAYEAARQLRQAGERVPLVVMADTWSPSYSVRAPFPHAILFSLRRRLNLRRHTLARIRALRFDEFMASTRFGKWNNRLIRISAALGLIKDLEEFTALRHQDHWFLPALARARRLPGARRHRRCGFIGKQRAAYQPLVGSKDGLVKSCQGPALTLPTSRLARLYVSR